MARRTKDFDRRAILSLEDGIALMESGAKIFEGVEFRYKGMLKHFVTHDMTTCVKCGIKAEHFYIERHTNDHISYHMLNMYAVDQQYGQYVERIMTHDHIIPKALGGSDSQSNAQVMCERCNSAKGCDTNLFDMVLSLKKPEMLKGPSHKKGYAHGKTIFKLITLVTQTNSMKKKKKQKKKKKSFPLLTSK